MKLVEERKVEEDGEKLKLRGIKGEMGVHPGGAEGTEGSRKGGDVRCLKLENLISYSSFNMRVSSTGETQNKDVDVGRGVMMVSNREISRPRRPHREH